MAARVSEKQRNAKDSEMPVKQVNHLSKFQKIGPEIWFYQPTAKQSTTDAKTSNNASKNGTASNYPHLVIMCSWMNASPRHILKYAEFYLTTYPNSAILMLRCAQFDVMFKPERQQLAAMKPAVTAIHSTIGSLTNTPQVLMHIFSNGGGWTAGLLCNAYKQATGGLTLPMTAAVIDSCPSIPRMRILHRELSMGLPKNVAVQVIGSVLIWILLVFIRILSRSGITSNVITRVRKHLNDPTGAFVKNGVPRVYICSDKDAYIPLGDVQKHAEDARGVLKKSGFTDKDVQQRIGLEQFEGSPHVGHMRVDQDRYWRIVQKVWTEGLEIQESRTDKLKGKL